jgi:DNA-directed RNA polymerase, mitochondrial
MTEPLATTDPRIERQYELEADMRAQGTQKFRTALAQCQVKGRESETTYGHALITRAIMPIAKGIREFLASESGSKAGRKPVAVQYLSLIEPEVAAFIAAKGVLDGIMTKQRLQGVAVKIGGMIEDEIRFQAFEEAKRINPKTGEEEHLKAYYLKVRNNLNTETSHYGHKRKVMLHSMQKMGVEWQDWSQTDRLHLGIKLVELVEQTTAVVERTMFVNRGKKEYYLSATEVTLEWIKGKTDWGELMCALYQPMLIPPLDWDGPTGGGYLGAGGWGKEAQPLGKLKVVKTRNKAYLEELYVQDLSLVYGSLNAIQKTAWKVNSDVLKVQTEMWRSSSHAIAGFPPRENQEKPAKPTDIETNLESRKVWKRAAHKIIRENFKLGSKRLQVDMTIRMAEKFVNEEAIYFPHTLDFRGRIYAVPVGLNPQGHDIAKGLLTFAQGKPLGGERSANWLAIHGSNLFGFDKVSLEERVEWVRQNQEHIVKSTEAPLDYLWWEQADKPWQFLAFCFEWVGYLKQGLSFVSCLPIALDGSCNGLQHFSAMLRDPIGGAAVNLTPSDKPRDIYQTVADKLIEKLKVDRSTMAHLWLTFGITRKTTKRPVMVVPYGGTRHSGRDYILEYVNERLSVPGVVNLFGDSKAIFAACNFLSAYLWDSIRETVVAARDAMDWLQKVSAIVAKEEKPLNWTAPSGFKVQQAYPNTQKRTVKTQIAGTLVYLNLLEELPTLDRRRQAQGISPNFVHSLDAAALVFTVNACTGMGIESFAMIHDSYGTLAADTDTLRECLRQSFAAMYQFDVLEIFRDEIQAGLPEGVKLPPLPTKGTLDINLVLQSDFFFA